ncbi:unnamed protein product [Brassicogethes aeneus]|uniref:protein-serine/threonine phosphatase n=1 Tax=Brassicogethes aeneus TaxID=1431903 RepID=A0A9P0B5L4_BRAAE|nr:unnamed protein product [Brassicogethes aeneus]
MLFILPPLTSQSPPSPWNAICCDDKNRQNKNKPPRITLRNLQIIKFEDEIALPQDDMDGNRNPKSLSECYFAGKGAALVLPDAMEAQKSAASAAAALSVAAGAGGRFASAMMMDGIAASLSSNIQKHLQSMFYLLRPEETLKMAVKLESVHPARTRYLVVVSRLGSRGEESCLLGIDCNEKTTVGLVLKVLANTSITLDGDGGFSVTVCERHHIFKPVSVQAMWSALQTLHKVSGKAREQNYFQGGMTHGWVSYYEDGIESDRSCLNEWHAMDNLESRRPPSPDSIRTKPTRREETERCIRATLKEIMMSVDLDEVTSKVIRTRLEDELDMDLGEYKSFIDQEMLVILGQMDAPTEIFEHVYLGSEWNASNYEELQKNGVGHILNVTREIDNFFPGTFDYLNVRVYDDEKTDLLKHWDDTFKYITKARETGSKVLVHCKMGVSRSASVVIAYAMKAYDMDFVSALRLVKDKRSCIKPNSSFLSQLETYQGILDAMKNKEKLQRSKSETNLKSPNKERVVVGSEPTPIVQALSKSLDLKQVGVRPKSWSPDNAVVGELLHGSKSSPVFLSLENLSVEKSKESDKVCVLMPCDNGESYSVSPNQIVHLPGHHQDDVVENEKTVLNLSKKFDAVAACDTSSFPQQQQQTTMDESRQFLVKSKETWDPGDSTTVNTTTSKSDACDSVSGESQPVWTSSAVLKHKSAKGRKESDVFSNQLDRVFDREEKREKKCPSRQNSWGSYDSAVVMSYQSENNSELSRQSSWGSGDTRTLLSRNSSWGSYDMRGRAISEKPVEKLIVVSDEIEIPAAELTSRGLLSKSAPEPSSMELIPQERALSRSASNVISTAQCSSVKQHKTLLESLHNKDSKTTARKSEDGIENSFGKVRNLKKEFEAKSSTNIDAEAPVVNSDPVKAKNRDNSILHQQQQQQQQQAKEAKEKAEEEVSMKLLIGMFEPNKEETQARVEMRPKPFGQNRNARYSCIEVGEKGPYDKIFISNLNKGKNDVEFKRPPIPVVRNSSLAATVIASAAKKQQQYGKSHPLARLSIKPRHNNPVYNTM